MKIVDLKDKPVYTALSYTWGTPYTIYVAGEKGSAESAPKCSYKIICSNHYIKITENCNSFLALCQGLKESITSKMCLARVSDISGIEFDCQSDLLTLGPDDMAYFWIDAICINQNSIPERSAQVKIMGDIYAKARTVLVWLGPEDSLSRDAMPCVNKLGNIPLERVEAIKNCTIADTDLYSKLGSAGEGGQSEAISITVQSGVGYSILGWNVMLNIYFLKTI